MALIFACMLFSSLRAFFSVPGTDVGKVKGPDNHHTVNRAFSFISERDDRARPRVLFTHASLLAPHRKGGDSHMLGVMMAFQQMGYDVTFAYPMRRFDDHHHMLEDIGVRVVGPMPSSSQVLKSHLETFKYELVVEFLWYNLQYSAFLRELNQLVKQAFPSTVVVTVTPDLNHERFIPERIEGEDPETFSRRRALFRQNLLDTETFFWSRAEVNSCVNVDICKHIHELYPSQHLQLQAFYQAMSPTKGGEQTWSDRTGVIYIGYENDENAMSLTWLVENVVPTFFRKHGESLHVYGSVEASSCGTTTGCVYHGPVSDDELSAAISSARWMVAPIFRSVGISTKILKALGSGTPVLTTPFGMGGMEHLDRKRIPVVTADARSFSTRLEEVYNDRRLWQGLHARAPEFVTKYFGLSTVVDANRNIVRTLRKMRGRQWGAKKVHVADLLTQRRALSVAWDVNKVASSYASITNMFPFLDSSGHVKSYYQGCPPKGSTVDVFVRMRWPVNFDRPTCCPRRSCKFVLYQPWEMGYIPESWVLKIGSNVDFVWTLTSFNARMFVRSGIDPAIVRTVPFGVNCTTLQHSAIDLRAELGIASSTRVLAYIGGALSRKGIDILLDAYTKAFTRKDDVLLLLKITYQHGGLDIIDGINAAANDASLPKIMVIEETDHGMGDVYQAIDVLIHPARAEGLGLTPMEALAAGKVVIAPDQGATNDYLSSAFAYLIPSKMEHCREYPCQGASLCVFPTRDGITFNACERLVKPPEWLSMDPADLAGIMTFVHSNFETAKELSHEGMHFACDNLQWNHIAEIAKAELYRAARVGFSAPRPNTWHDPLPALVRLGGTENYFGEFPGME
jgi:glycosyltransferase involved in cell wall biosynthesis